MASPKQVNVNVIVVPDSSKPEGVRFELSSNIGSSNELTFKNDHHPGFEVDFKLVDNDKTGCKFMHAPSDAMWVQKIEPETPNPCPTSAMYWEQFEAKTVSQGDTQLSVRNLNQFAQKFAFSLRFTKPGWDGPILYDPIGNNQNGDGGGFTADRFASSPFGMLLLVAGIVALGIVAYRFLA